MEDRRMRKKLTYLVDTVTGQFKSIGGCHNPDPTRNPSFGKDCEPKRFEANELPPAVDMRPFMTDVEDQAISNSCTANAIVGAYEYIMKRNGIDIDFSRLFVYYNARALATDRVVDHLDDNDEVSEADEVDERGIQDEGSPIHAALEGIFEYGVCREKTWNYEMDEKIINSEPSEESYEEAEHLRTVSHFQFEDAERVKIDLFTMKHCLAEGHPIVIGVPVFENFDCAQFGKSGRVPMPDLLNAAQRESHGRHAMLVVGYKDSAQHFVVRNSWGPDWAVGGYCYMPYEYIANPIFTGEAWIIKGHKAEAGQKMDYSEDIWDEKDEPFGKEFDEEFDTPKDQLLFTLPEAIVALCILGSAVDGVSEIEFESFMDLLDDYGLSDDLMQDKYAVYMEKCGGSTAVKSAAVKIILAHKAEAEAFRISADFAFLDGKLTLEEIDFWKVLAKDLKLPEDFATSVFSTLLQEQPDTITLVLPTPLKFHARGVAVEQLQKGLTAAGYPVKVNGFFGKPTKQAVRNFQKDNGLKRDCIVGHETWELLFKNYEGCENYEN